MATPLTAAEFLKALRDEGCKVITRPGWEDHNRNSKGPWGPVNGTLVHHTVTKGTQNTVDQVWNGYAVLPGPLCHGMIAKNGTIYLVGYGRTNHAGGGDPIVLDHVINEDYGDRPPKPTKGNANGVDGNRHFYGWECENLGDGKDPWPDEQYDAIVRAQAAVIRAHRAKGDNWGAEAKSLIGHLEWSNDKIDPRGFDMKDLRSDVAERLTHLASWNPTKQEEDPMAGMTNKDIFDAVWRTDAIAAPTSSPTASTNKTWAAASVLSDIVNNVRAIRAAETAQTAAITALAKLIGSGVDTAAVVAAVREEIRDAVVKVSVDVNGPEA